MIDSCTNTCDNFCINDREYCFWEKIIKPNIQEMINNSLGCFVETLEVLKALRLDTIKVYDDCNPTTYCCNEVIVYRGSFFKSLRSNNDRHPHDASAWEELGSLVDILLRMSFDEQFSTLRIPYYPECTGANCAAKFNDGDIIAIKHDTGNTDSCGNSIFVDHYYVSLSDDNTEYPVNSSQWNGPLSLSEVLAMGGEGQPINICNIAQTNNPTLDSEMLFCNNGQLNKSTMCNVINNSIPTV